VNNTSTIVRSIICKVHYIAIFEEMNNRKSLPSLPGKKAKAKRLGAAKGGGSGDGSKMVGDARLKIIQASRSKTVDARDKLAQLAKKTDARQKLENLRLRNAQKTSTDTKGGIGDVGIVRAKQNNGKLFLSTNRAIAKKVENKQVQRVGNFTKTVLSSGKVSLSTGKSRSAPDQGMRSKTARSRDTEALRTSQTGRSVSGRGRLTESQRLDEELMSSSVDKDYNRLKNYRTSKPVDRSSIMRSRSPLHARSRSPLRSRS